MYILQGRERERVRRNGRVGLVYCIGWLTERFLHVSSKLLGETTRIQHPSRDDERRELNPLRWHTVRSLVMVRESVASARSLEKVKKEKKRLGTTALALSFL